MSNPVTDLFTGGLGTLTGNVKGILDKFIPDQKDKLEAQSQVEQMAHELEVKVIEADRDLAVQQASIITAEVKSDSWLARNWRPLTMLSFVFIIDFDYILSPLFHLTPLPIPPELWKLITYGLSGYVGLRSGEKIAGQVIEAIKK